MNFKKFLGTALTVMCALVMTTTLTACGGDDDNNKGGGSDNKAVAASMNAVLSVGDDMLNYFNLTIDYYDANGKIQSEPLKENKWEKTIKASLPATLGVRLKAQLKDGIDPTTIDLLSIKTSFTYGYNTLTANDGILEVFADGHGSSYSIKGSDIPEWLDEDANKIVQILYTFDASGKYSKGSWE
jgi:major membrane immunogen (membrane-anchored lipoprotein)